MQKSSSSELGVQQPPEAQEVRGQLARIITSPEFNVPERLRGFLTFVVEETLAGHGDRIKAYSVAIEVFGRTQDFDVQNDPVVRIEAARLRRALERYYLTGGRDDPILIDIPKGGYTPKIHRREGCAAAPDPVAATAPIQDAKPIISERFKQRTFVSRTSTMIAALLLLCVAASVGAVVAHRPDAAIERGNPEVTLFVSPFANLSGTEGALYAAGISDELLNQLARFRELRVISRERPKLVSLGPQLLQPDAVQYLLEGSVRLVDKRLRVSSRLLNGQTAEIIWNEVHERDLQGAERLDIEADIATKVAVAVAQPYGAIFSPTSRDVSARAPAGTDTYVCVLRFYQYRREPTLEEHRVTRDCLSKTVAQNPSYSTGWAMLAYLYLDEDRLGFNRQQQPLAGKVRAREAAERAARLDPSNVRALQALMVVLFYSKEPEAALKIGERALALNPNDTEILAEYGSRLAQSGNRARGLAMIEEAIERNPNQTRYFIAILAQNYYLIGNNERALYWIRRANMSKFANYYLTAALIFARAHLEEETKASVREFLKMRPHFFENFDEELAMRNFNTQDRLILIEGARRAGFPVGAIDY
ncbi:TPR_REGION domain-containing protein [Hyphomicrobiales bacterium]|nr:TPR_REGION domain-containing protein [Hyphomicrobiales bacterium]CAH1699574.1 TPR_REGION domain-containing protein [Hyphomicrobiales bacterium]CAI0344579.1 TPR_REGION domain-containing protein [Hyphomicrobiales bacterium]